MSCLLCPKNPTKNSGGYFQRNWGGVRHASWNSYPISDQTLRFSLPYFRPDQKFDTLFQNWSPGANLEPGAWPERVTSCYGTYTVVGVNIKREMVLSPNDEEVECTNHTLFQTKMVEIDTLFQTRTAEKNILFGAAHTYTYIRDYPPPPPAQPPAPPPRKTRCRLWVSLLTQARLIKEGRIFSKWEGVNGVNPLVTKHLW